MKIHIISNSLNMNSGFSIVARHLAIGLKKLNHDVTMTGMQSAYTSSWHYGVEVLPIQVNYIDDMTQFMMTLNRIKPDVVLAIFQMDMGTNNPFTKVFPKTVLYVPVEGRNIPQDMANDLLQIKMNGGLVVAQTIYGKSEMKLALGGLDVPYIYHGYDPEIFKPLDLKKIDDIRYCYYKTEDGKVDSDPISLHKQGCYDCQLNNKEQVNCPYYKEEQVSILRFINGKWTEENILITDLPNIAKNKWVFGFVGQNIGIRKRIERLLKAYSIFIKDSKQLKDRTVLHLHTKPIAIDGVNLIKVIQDLGIQDNIIFSYGTHGSSGWTEQAMNILYNTFDVNTSASSSEGYGLPTLESMACGKPNIGPNCSSFTELIGEDPKTRRGLLAAISDWQMIQDSSIRALVNECLLPDSPIMTLNRGIQKIKDIEIGDKVLTHKGRFKRVNEVMKREYSGDMIEIVPYKLRISIILTPEHPVLGIKTVLCEDNSVRRSKTICRPGIECYRSDNGYKYCKHIDGYEPYRKYKVEWISAKDLRSGDFVSYPRPQEYEKDVENIRILDYIDEFLNVTGDNYDDYSQQTDLFGELVEKKIAMNNPYSRKHAKIPAEIKLTKDLMRLFGYFISEGDIGGDKVNFTFNINETLYIKDVENLMRDIFGLEAEHLVEYKGVQSHQLRYANKVLNNMMRNMFCPKEYIYNKERKANVVRIPPEFLDLPREKLAELIKGEWRGDGNKTLEKGYMITTTSDILAYQITYILSKFGMLATITRKNGTYKYKDEKRISTYYQIGIFGKDIEIFDSIIGEKHRFRQDIDDRVSKYLKGRNFYFPEIDKINIIKYSGYVYNLRVEDDNTYLCPIVVHNCDLTNQMKTIYKSEELRKTFSKNAIKFAKDYTWEKICWQWNQLLKTIK